MERISRAWAVWVLNHRIAILIIAAVTVCSAPLSYHQLYHDNSNESYFLEQDPNLEAFDRLVDLFGDPEYLLVGIEARANDHDIFTADTIQMIDEITRFLEDHRYITKVRSISKYQYTHDDGGMLATDDLFEDIDSLDQSSVELLTARDIIAREQIALENIVTRDFKHTQIIARTIYRPGENQHKVELVQELRGFVDSRGYEASGHRLHFSGAPVIGERFETLTENDKAWLNPLMGCVMFVIIYIVFRSLFAVLVPLLITVATLVVITGLQGALKWPFTAINAALIPTAIILCMGACVHVLVEFFQFRNAGTPPLEAARETVTDLLFAILFTCVTTAVGFLALSVTELKPVRQFAVLAAIAPMLIFLLSTTVLPAILSFVPWLPRRKPSRNKHSAVEEPQFSSDKPARRDKLSALLTDGLPRFIKRNRKTITLLGCVVALAGFVGITQMRVDANIANYFKASSAINKDLNYFNRTFKGISNVDLILNSGEEGGIKAPKFLQQADQLQQWLASFPETGKPTSILDFYKQINQSLHEDDPRYFTLPDSRAMAAQLLLLYENSGPDEDLTDLKDFSDQNLRIRVPVVNMDETQLSRLFNNIRDEVALSYSNLDVVITGTLVMNNAQNHYVNNGMFKSFGVAILTIGVSFILLFRSLTYGLIALIPSVVPVLLTGAIVSLAGIPMDLGTMIVGAMTIGIAVDDSIHLMSRYLLMRKRGLGVDAAIKYAMNSSGRAVILTSIILVCGFSVMLLGSFMSYIYVGLFSAMIMSLALLGDLIFMPALLYLIDGKSSLASLDEHTYADKSAESNLKSQHVTLEN
jgi:Predicted exporters of the RND superfamily